MAIQITIIGLNQIGASLGLALRRYPDLTFVIGYDKDRKLRRQCKSLKAVDKTTKNLIEAVKTADIILLCLPLAQVRDTLKTISHALKPGSIIMDTGSIKGVIANWASEFIPEDINYIGLTPGINPRYLHRIETGIEFASDDLFDGGRFGIVINPMTPEKTIELTTQLVELLGATHYFVDAMENDGLVAMTHTLPRLLSTALINTTISQPGWQDGSKVAGRAYAFSTAPIAYATDAEALSAETIHNRENILRLIDDAIAELQTMRDNLAEQNIEAFNKQLINAINGQKEWWTRRQRGESGKKS